MDEVESGAFPAHPPQDETRALLLSPVTCSNQHARRWLDGWKSWPLMLTALLVFAAVNAALACAFWRHAHGQRVHGEMEKLVLQEQPLEADAGGAPPPTYLAVDVSDGGAAAGTAEGVAVAAAPVDLGEPVPPSTGSAQPWIMCPDTYQCGNPSSMMKWNLDPMGLADSVPKDLEDLPPLSEQAYHPVRDHWNEAPPQFWGRRVRLSDIAAFMKDLLTSNPFNSGAEVPYVNFAEGDGGPNGQVVAITHRQLAFLVANVLMGNSIPGGDGLSSALTRCSAKDPPVQGFIYSLLSLLAVLSQELQNGASGSYLVAMRPSGSAEELWKERLETSILVKPTLCTQVGDKKECNLASDFMAGGVPNQAITDIAGTVVGGGGELCHFAFTQDESLVLFYSEVLAFAFFVPDGQMMPVPWLLLGSRRYMNDIFGQTSLRPPYGSQCGYLFNDDWLNQAMINKSISVSISGVGMSVPASAFVAVASVATTNCDLEGAKSNNCDQQRRHLDQDLALWFQAFESSMYNPVVQEAFSDVIERIGTGPWGAGAWWGDSQQYFLAVWLATSLLSSANLDYYLYDHFCENPSNQCYLLGRHGCKACIEGSEVFDDDRPKAERCGNRTIQEMIEGFVGKPSKVLYERLRDVGSPPGQVFDVMNLV